MKTNNVLLIAVMLVVMAVSITCVWAYSDTLNWNSSEDQLNGSGDWASIGTYMNWSVTYNTATSHWLYQYTLTVDDDPEISHMIIETSPSFTNADIKSIGYTLGSYSSYEIGSFLSTSQSNPNMPSNIYGIKFDGTQGKTLSVYFESDRTPVWGDFYAKGGNNKSVFNSGFTVNDIDLSSLMSANEAEHILRPDTVNTITEVPEASSMLALCSGLAAIIGSIGFRRRK